MTDLAKLVVRLEAQTNQYQAALEAAEKKLKKFEKAGETSARNIAGGLAVAAAAAATAIAVMTKAAIDNADQVYKMSQATGVSVESLSRLEHAAKLSDISLEELGKNLGILNRQAVAAAKGTDKAEDAFKAIDVAVQNADGSMRSTEEVLLDVAQAFSKMQDGAAKSALAQDLFGKSGAKMIPFLNQGKAGIAALTKEADALGLTISEKTGKAAEQFNDNLTRLGAVGKGLANQVAGQLLPGFTALTEKWIESAKAGGNLNAAATLIAGAFKTLVSAGVIVTSIFQQLGRLIYGVGSALVSVAKGDFQVAKQELVDAFEEAKGNVSDDIDTIAQLWSEVPDKIADPVEKIDETLGNSLIFNDKKAEEKAKKVTEAAVSSLLQLEQQLAQQVATLDMADAAALRYRLTLGDLATTVDEAGPSAAILTETIVAYQEQLDAIALKQKNADNALADWNELVERGAQVIEETRTPAERYSEQIERLNELLEKGIITQDTYNRAVGKSQEAFDKAMSKNNDFLKRASENTQDIIADALVNGFEGGARGMLKTFVDMLLKMQAQALAAKIAQAIFGDGQGSGGGIWGSIAKAAISSFGGGAGASGAGSMDSGGRGKPGQRYTIGTGAQPEYFVPDRPGTFMTQDQMRPQVTVRPMILNVRDPSEIPNALQQGEGEQAILNVVSRNPSIIRNMLQG